MGKVRTRVLGIEEIEEKQKKQQKQKADEKKKVKMPGKHKGGDKSTVVSLDKEHQDKLDQTKEFIEGKTGETKEDKKSEKKKATKARKRGKRYLLAKKAVDKAKLYDLDEALKTLKKLSFTKFDESVELHLNVEKTGLNGEVKLPHETGKKVKVKIVDDKLLADVEKGKIDFDILIARPSDMAKIAKFARVLGPKGLMPNPKTGTISDKPEETAKKFTTGGLRWKTEPKAPLVHQAVGKLSFNEKDLAANIKALVVSLGKQNIKEAYLTASMTPSVKLNLEQI